MILTPPSTLVIGPGGTGKTTCIKTLLRCGLHVRMIATEPSAPNRVLEECAKSIPPIDTKNFHWKFVSPSVAGWDALQESAKIVNTMSLKDIADMKTGIARSNGTQWMQFLQACACFISDKDGANLGDVTSWDEGCALVIDGMTGISTMSRNLTVGLKPNPAPGEWGVMQGNLLNVMQKLTSDCNCFFILIAHVERETNELTGGSNITVSTLGAKLAPKLPPLFTTVVLATKNGTIFKWSTATMGVDTKNGDLPLADNLEPDFTPIVEGFRKRLKTAQPGTVAQP